MDHDFENKLRWLHGDLHDPESFLELVGLGHLAGPAEWLIAATLGAGLGTGHYLYVRRSRRSVADQAGAPE